MPLEPVEVFFSYSHKDENFKDKLLTHLTMLKKEGVISSWHDRLISPGSEWAKEIDTHIESAKVILLLISADFLDSTYCHDIELKRAMERHASQEAIVIPIMIKPVDCGNAPFSQLQALPKNAKAVTLWSNREKAFLNIAQGIRHAIENLQ